MQEGINPFEKHNGTEAEKKSGSTHEKIMDLVVTVTVLQIRNRLVMHRMFSESWFLSGSRRHDS